MIVTHKNSCIIVNLLESDRIAVESHFMATCIIVKPKMVETVASCLLTIVYEKMIGTIVHSRLQRYKKFWKAIRIYNFFYIFAIRLKLEYCAKHCPDKHA